MRRTGFSPTDGGSLGGTCDVEVVSFDDLPDEQRMQQELGHVGLRAFWL